MYDKVLVITINSYYSKVPSTGTAVLFWYYGTLKKYRAHHWVSTYLFATT